MSLSRLPQSVIKQLGYYVYLYIHPLDNCIFYVGKGKGNRIFHHLQDASETRKNQLIRKILPRLKRSVDPPPIAPARCWQATMAWATS